MEKFYSIQTIFYFLCLVYNIGRFIHLENILQLKFSFIQQKQKSKLTRYLTGKFKTETEITFIFNFFPKSQN